MADQTHHNYDLKYAQPPRGSAGGTFALVVGGIVLVLGILFAVFSGTGDGTGTEPAAITAPAADEAAPAAPMDAAPAEEAAPLAPATDDAVPAPADQ